MASKGLMAAMRKAHGAIMSIYRALETQCGFDKLVCPYIGAIDT